ncbi:putative serine dehydratase domain-containing protein [Pseudoneurospora amorphoporcata]|uniref:Serine dehydratase domain-containing protein n=1 Tax=Pseudoneurospora amorphoporcata TaxID=241081 RepID=A0AAN6P5F9_9PEZI|nr:putative serine dehydratase domain-containing protein [Pseudoneurospora amorphoporcata]
MAETIKAEPIMDQLKQKQEALRAKFVGKQLSEVPTPSVVLDLKQVTVNCERMLEAAENLGLQWRAHIKTHKTTELTRLQVGNFLATTPVLLIVSTILEAENITPLLKEYQSKGRAVNVLFSFPLFASAVPRLAAVSSQLGPDSLSVMIDHVDQLPYVKAIQQISGHPPRIFIKIDANYGRAGVKTDSPEYPALIDALLAAEQEGWLVLHGVYTHAGQSYGARRLGDAMYALFNEFLHAHTAARKIREKSPGHASLVLSVGATPTATTIQSPWFMEECDVPRGNPRGSMRPFEEELTERWGDWQKEGYILEVHAGVYPTLDLQQVATHARHTGLLSEQDIGISVVAEVASVYPTRGKDSTPEALINAGSLALGREPVSLDKKTCADETKAKPYTGWGALMPWGVLAGTEGRDRSGKILGEGFPDDFRGWQVGKISQEHGILTWVGDEGKKAPELRVGDRVRVWPNHACIMGAGFEYYLIVDSRYPQHEDKVLDVWCRWNGW